MAQVVTLSFFDTHAGVDIDFEQLLTMVSLLGSFTYIDRFLIHTSSLKTKFILELVKLHIHI